MTKPTSVELNPKEGSSGKFIFWLLTFAAAMIISMTGAWALDMRSTDKALDVKQEALETRLQLLERSFALQQQQLQTIDSKVDVIIQLQKSSSPSLLHK